MTISSQADWFQSVSGLWDRRNVHLSSRVPCFLRFNPSPVCGTGEMCNDNKR